VNFLAHLVLAPQTPEGWVGSILPDMVRGPLPRDLRPAVLEAAREHQRIDRYTDTHPAFVRTRDRLKDSINPRLAGVLADVLYDHVLARDWSKWQGGSLAAFIDNAHQGFNDHEVLMPDDMRWRVRLMVDQGWLASYQTPEGIRDRLVQMSARLSHRLDRPMSLVIEPDDLQRIYTMIADDFDVLWSDLMDFVAEHRRNAATRLAC